jgi:hypothetical protein
LPTPKECQNHCGELIYFDSKVPAGRTSQGRWIPLLYNKDTGVYTGQPHQCSKSPYKGNGNHQQQQQQPQQSQPQSQAQRQEQQYERDIESEPIIVTVLKEISLRLQKITELLEEDQKEREALK